MMESKYFLIELWRSLQQIPFFHFIYCSLIIFSKKFELPTWSFAVLKPQTIFSEIWGMCACIKNTIKIYIHDLKPKAQNYRTVIENRDPGKQAEDEPGRMNLRKLSSHHPNVQGVGYNSNHISNISTKLLILRHTMGKFYLIF